MRYLIIEFEDSDTVPDIVKIKELVEISGYIHFIGYYPTKEAAQCCSVIRERLIEKT